MIEEEKGDKMSKKDEIKDKLIEQLDKLKAKWNTIKEDRKKYYNVIIYLDVWRGSDVKEVVNVTKVQKTLRYLKLYIGDKHKIFIPLERLESYEVKEVDVTE